MSHVTEPQPLQNESDADGTAPTEVPTEALRIRYRIRFAKAGLLRWISHRDLARLWERLLRRAFLRLSMTEGFHPKPRVGFPSALALGVEGWNEVVEIELAENLSPTELLERLCRDDQPGLTIRSVCRLPEQFGKAQLLRSQYTITTPTEADPSQIQDAITRLMATEKVSVERKKKTMTVTVSEQISELDYREGSLHLALEATDAASLRPGDVLDLLGFGDWIEQGATIARTDVLLERDLQSEDPTVMAVARETE